MLKSGGASTARASFGKMTVWIIQLQGKGSRLNGSAFLLPLSRIPTLPARDQLGNFYYLLSPKWGWDMHRLRGGLSTQSAAAAPSPRYESVQGQFWTGDTPGVLWARADDINRGNLLEIACYFSPQLKQCPPGWPLQRGHWYWVPHWLGANIGCEADCVVITEASTGDWVLVFGLPGATLSNHCGDFLPYAMVF